MIRKDCFAYNEKENECFACSDLNCQKCKFYKPKAVGSSVKKIKMITEMEITNEDFLKHNIKSLDNQENIDFNILKNMIIRLKHAKAEIVDVIIIDSYDPNYVENYEKS